MILFDTLRRTITQHDLVTPGDRVLVAVSGGPDSLTLLHALHTLRSELGLSGLEAAHLDHGLRGAEAAADAAFVAAFCEAHGLPCHVGKADVAALTQQRKVSTQQAARVVRYQFLEATADAVRANKIATGHTQDDQAETVLLNILRGSGLGGLRGIPVQRDLFIRPMLETSRADVVAYCEANGLTPRLDASNLATDHYTRNRIRLELLPQLARDYNPGVRDALLRLSHIATRDADYLAQQAQATLGELILSSEPTRLVLDRIKMAALHPALLRHVLRAALAQFRGTSEAVTHEHLEPLCTAIAGERRLPFGLTTPPPHCAVRVAGKKVTLTRRHDV